MTADRPFFLIVDDGGFPSAWPDGRGETIHPSAYDNLGRIAEHFDIQIMLACTSRFLDVHRVSDAPSPHHHSAAAIASIERFHGRILLADHGYTHQLGDSYREFHDPVSGRMLEEREQARHIDQSLAIYRSLGWPAPQVLVPPAHGWVPGVTDRLYAGRGFRFLSSVLWIKRPLGNARGAIFSPLHRYPDKSSHLTILPRLGMGIPAHRVSIGALNWWRAYASVMPTPLLQQCLFHRRPVRPPHNYMAHIANFAHESNYRGWCRLLEKVHRRKSPLARSFESSLGAYLE